MLIILGLACILIGTFFCFMVIVSIKLTRVAKDSGNPDSPYSVEAIRDAVEYVNFFGSSKNLKIARIKTAMVGSILIILGCLPLLFI